MKIERLKTLLLIFLIALSIYQTGQLWFQPFSASEKPEEEVVIKNIYLWDKIKPEKISIFKDEKITTYKEEYCDEIWLEFIDIFEDYLKGEVEVSQVENFEFQGIVISLPNPLPKELFIEGLEIKNTDFNDKVKSIKSFYIPEGKFKIIIENNEGDFIKIDSDVEINRKNINNLSDKIKENTEFTYNENINDIDLNLVIPTNEYIMNPVIVKSEINIEDEEYITDIAKSYYNDNYDYVRKSVESNNSVNYVYKNEKVLRINSEGLLEFYDTAENTIGENNVYVSLLTALKFTEDFLGYPENAYLTEVESIQRDGNYGFRFSFDYKILNRPIIFSQVREERALEIEVIGKEVVLYKRFIRVIDLSDPSLMEEKKAINPIGILEDNIGLLAMIQIEENKDLRDEEIIENSILESIEEMYLGYYDPSRKLSEQLIRSVWVMKTQEKRYIFNAVTGNLVEIQNMD
ncbi:MAG: hypothetical protein R6U59_03370 [Eubacteriales bacterium]